MITRPKPFLLVVLDGWGYREKNHSNAILNAKTPYWDELWQKYPHTLISASGPDVGLPPGQMGNSEVGHLHMGAGRLVPQDLYRINLAIESKEFFQNPILNEALDRAIKVKSNLHILGLMSPGGVHSHENHILAFAEMAAQKKVNFYIHGILDGRDTPPKSALTSLKKTADKLHELNGGKIISLIGRFFAMDRDLRWNRTEKAYELLTQGKAQFHATTAELGLEAAYKRGETDEFVEPISIHEQGESPITIKDNDVVIFMNFRADRARQLTRAFVDKEFTSFPRHVYPNLNEFVTLTEYADNLGVKIAFPPIVLTNVLGAFLADQNFKQLRIAETEKYAHVTYFINGGREEPFVNEDRVLIPSPKVATYDLQPEMSANAVTDKLVEAIISQKYDLIICNYANPDMVGHTGNLPATIIAIETIDHCLQRVITALKSVNGEALITSDHGNAELMYDPATGQPHTAHTTLPVPLIYVGKQTNKLEPDGKLYNIAPTILTLMHLPIPKEMDAKSLVILPAS